MPILYSVVARGKCILAEYAESNLSGNYALVTQVLLGKIDLNSGDTKMTYSFNDEHLFHYLVQDGITFLCMTDKGSRRRTPFLYLEDLGRRWGATFGGAGHTAIAYAMNRGFAPVLRRQAEHFNGQDGDDIERVKNQIDEVKDVMMQNIDSILERGEKLELLVERSDNLVQESFRFQKSAKALKRSQYWRRIKMTFFGLVLMLSFAYFVAASACGFTFNDC
mmetsp:Transcript_7151/g.11540  ORF Transcript_7151/g.11540 Transcript_7151/m.11540 type:complete len:221 (+) Transcript_7151:78-740(+)|eukprot:CAMPEP_0194584312 /NCGR_PEP_ID=MMETSP0292-20121207/16961_1 /TAXON_ID=39354 /ORGANISM="Heterosigma akashiwo, Strain CCMP2393" /LENGTH=220 /DNA_ID=CAMNT_0039439303 /DNA_START=77 /DNA_END=739 /DNA_ORIENTATION=+